MQDLKWVNGDSAIMVWDVAIDSKILIYSVATGSVLNKFEPEAVCLGIKTLSLSTNKFLTAAGMFDSIIILYNNITASEIAQLQHHNQIDLRSPQARTLFVYQEEA